MNAKLPASPLASIVAAAKKSLPDHTGATARAEYVRSRPRRSIILADVSQSMAEPAGHRRKIDVLSDALRTVGSDADVVAFSTHPVQMLPGQQLPEPRGGTALHLALDYCTDATHVLVISDGHPDNPHKALAAADRLRDTRIDVIYCGPENDHEGVAFMSRLARHGGRAQQHALSDTPLAIAAVRLMLAGPGK